MTASNWSTRCNAFGAPWIALCMLTGIAAFGDIPPQPGSHDGLGRPSIACDGHSHRPSSDRPLSTAALTETEVSIDEVDPSDSPLSWPIRTKGWRSVGTDDSCGFPRSNVPSPLLATAVSLNRLCRLLL
jgi:hypothetical protein